MCFCLYYVQVFFRAVTIMVVTVVVGIVLVVVYIKYAIAKVFHDRSCLLFQKRRGNLPKATTIFVET